MPLPSATIPNPAFYQDEEVREQVADAIMGPFATPEELYAALPAEYGYALPDEGGWIIVKRIPHTEIPAEVTPLYSIWRARPFYRHRKLPLRVPRKTWINWPMLRAVIQTPEGELHLLPGEYVPTSIEKWLDLLGRGLTMHFLGDRDPEELAEPMFYLRSRGLSRREALGLLLPQLEDDSFAYFTLEV